MIVTCRQQRVTSVLGAALLLLSVTLLLLGASVGSTGFDSILRAWNDPVALQIVWDIRLPRTLGAWAAGALLGLAGAVAQVLLMDEPLANLDPPHQADWLLMVRELVGQGKTVVSVLHEISMALHADQMVIMAQGRVTHQGACADTATHRALGDVFERRIAIHALGGQWVALPLIRKEEHIN